MRNAIKKLFSRATPGTAPTPALTDRQRELLGSLRTDLVPDPVVVRAEQAAILELIAAAEAEWSRLTACDDDVAYLRRQPQAETLAKLRAQVAPYAAAIIQAEAQRDAFLKLVEWFGAVSADVTARTMALVMHPPQDVAQRTAAIADLDRATRLHSRLAGRLRTVSHDPDFKDPVDAFSVLRNDLERRLSELDRQRRPGTKGFVLSTLPPEVDALLTTLGGAPADRKAKTA